MAEELRFVEETPEERAFDYARTVALSDGVFAIALTLLVLSISVPTLGASHHSELGKRLLDRREEFLSYGISFAVISVFWVRHHFFFRSLARIDTQIAWLNLAYLALVAFLPYPTQLLGLYGDDPASVVLYASSLAIATALAGLARLHAGRARLLTPTGERELARREHWLITPAIFLVSIPLSFASTTAAKLLWVLLLFPNVGRRVPLRPPRQNKAETDRRHSDTRQ